MVSRRGSKQFESAMLSSEVEAAQVDTQLAAEVIKLNLSESRSGGCRKGVCEDSAVSLGSGSEKNPENVDKIDTSEHGDRDTSHLCVVDFSA